MALRIAALFLLLLSTGCSRSYNEFIRFRDNGRAKPQVALIPVVDHAQHNVPWNVSEELTAGMRHRLMEQGVVYMSSEHQVRSLSDRTEDADLFGKDLSWARQYSPHDFVVLVELIDHRKVPYERQKVRPVYPADGEVSSVLMMKARLKVVDIREEMPKVILQQIVHSNHLIPKNRDGLNYHEIPWDDEVYKGTPLGMAHARLERDIVGQLEHYIDTVAR